MPSDVLITPASSKIDFTDGANATKTLKITGTSLNIDTSFAIGATTANNTLSVLGSASIGSSYNVAAPSNGLIVQGNVGIGTTTPTSKLTVTQTAGADSVLLELQSNNDPGIRFGRSTYGSLIRHISATVDYIAFNCNGTSQPSTSATAQVVFDENGNVGIGTIAASGRLHVNSTTAGATLLRADGTNGTLFSVVDDLSDSLMSVNNSAGLPVLEVFADDRVVAGQYGANDFVISGNKVGIGTASPTGKLTIFQGNNPGITLFSNNAAQYAYLQIGRTSSELEIGVVSGSNQFFTGTVTADAVIKQNSTGKLHLGYGSAAPAITIDSSNNVGIGTVSPTLSSGKGLHINSASGHANVKLQSSGRTWELLSTTGAYFSIYDTTGGADRLSISSSGNVGVGNTSPNNKLHIAGSASIGSSYNVAGPANGLVVQGNVGVGTTTAYTRTHVYGTLTVDAAGATVNSFTEGIRLGAASNGYSIVTFGANAGASSGQITNQWWIGKHGGDNSFNFNSQGGGDVFRILQNGNVGIGNTTPNYKLYVNGNGYFNSTLQVNSNITLSGGGDVIINDSDGTGSFNSFMDSGVGYIRIDDGGSANGTLNINSGTLFVGPSSGNVGVGNTTPTAKLQIGTNSTSVVGDNSSIVRIGSSNAGGRAYNLTLANTAAAQVSNDSSMSFIVAGNYSATSVISAVLRSTVTAATDLVFTNYNNALFERMRIQFDGNVGIGTASPGTSLEIYATPATSTTLRQMLIINTDFGSASGTGFGGSIVFRGRTAGNLLRDNAQITAYNEDIGDNGYALGFFTRPNDTLGMVQRMTIARGGNVGIGTASPSAKLDVAGTINISNGSANLRRLSFDASGVYYNWIESGGSAGAGYMAFAAGNSESMRIITGGNVGIGTTTPATLLQIGTGTPTAATGGIQFGGDTGTRLYRSASGIITCSGTIAATFSGALTGNVTGNVSGSSGSCTGNAAGSSTFVAGLGVLNYDIDRTTKRVGLSHYTGYSTGTNRPTTYDYTLQVTDGSKGWEISMDWIATTGPAIYARSLRDCCQNWSSWVRILDSANYSFAANMNQNVRTTDNVTFGIVTATFSGALTGNVTGNVSGTAGGETLGTVTGRGASTSTQITVSTAAGGSMYTGTKFGAGYSDGVSGATFKSITDHPTGGSYAFASYYNGSSGTNSFYVAADGSGYFKSLLTTGSISTGAITSAVIKADAGANYPHSFTNTDAGNTHWVNRSDRLLTSNGTGWQTDGRDPIMALVTSGNTNNVNIANSIGLALHNESQTNNTFSPAITFSNRSNSGIYNTTYAAIIGRKTGQGIDSNWSAGELHFYTMPVGAYVNNIPSLIINSAANIGIGTTNPVTLLQVGAGTPTASGSGIQFGNDTTARLYRSSSGVVSASNSFSALGGFIYASNYLQTGGNLIYPASFSATQRLEVGNTAQNAWITGISIAPGGNVVVAGTLTESSSIRYKENIQTVSAPILPKLNEIRPVTYNKKDNPNNIEYGIIAEELNDLFPELVNKNNNGEVESVNYSRLTVLLIKAVKELKQEIEILKNK